MQFEITPTKYSNSIQVQSNEDNQEIFTYFQLKNQDSILPIARLNSENFEILYPSEFYTSISRRVKSVLKIIQNDTNFGYWL